jgi:hypothetical protein
LHLQEGQHAGGDSPLRLCAAAADGPAADAPEAAHVGDLMTPVVYSVTPETGAKEVVEGMLTLGVHRLFVIAEDGALVGVISSTDLLRQLHEPVTVSFEDVELLCADGDAGARAEAGLGRDSTEAVGTMPADPTAALVTPC